MVSLDPDTTTVQQTQSAQSSAVRNAVEEMRDQLPDGLSPEEVGKWWAALTPQQQHQLMLAAPVELHDLPGVPAEVKAQLTNSGNGYNSIEALRWARANANNEGLNRFDNNCALFVSESLRAGGLSEKQGQWSKLDWTNLIPDIPGFKGKDLDGLRFTKSWYNADAQRDFFLNNGGLQLPPSGARPGDVIYFNWDNSATHGGETSHHAAIVSAVLPDGEVLYTQHTPGAVNYSLQDRWPMGLQEEGGQNVIIVRPKETW
ncbi:amidase domain-containing protein [Mycobacterium sp. TY814]|nr:amidase domain-containing protein [Mycobacterium sp. TY814]MDP7722180.1 amidase domain-containing protein [Mycobacterium sp. TY814]